MKLLVTGAGGQLGSDVVNCSEKLGVACVGVTRKDFDIVDRQATRDFITACRPDVVIHCAAYNAVDKAEEDKDLCYSTNAEGTANVAMACRACHAKMMYISTDYVFDGKKKGVYETDDTLNPLSVYGKSKADGGIGVQKVLDRYFIVRTSWLFGSAGKNFVKIMADIAKNQEQVSVVDHQIGSPTYTDDLAPLLVQMAASEKFGIYHTTNEAFCSRAEFAEEIMRLSNFKCEVNRVTSAEYSTKSSRPKNSRLSKDKLLTAGFYKLPMWQDALRRFLNSSKILSK